MSSNCQVLPDHVGLTWKQDSESDVDVSASAPIPAEIGICVDESETEGAPPVEDAKEDGMVEKMAMWFSEMKATRPEILRAVPAWCVLQSCGKHLNSKLTKKEKARLYAFSRQVEEIDEFWSHSWHGRTFWKVWSLLFVKNSWPALIISCFLAALMALFFALGLLPGWVKMSNYAPSEPHAYCVWSLVTGVLSYVLVIIFWRPRGKVFVDLFCIHQANPKLKAEGLLSLGAILKKSKAMLVMWDETYLKRLWCVFELAAFLQSHRGVQARGGSLLFKPIALAPATFANIMMFCLLAGLDLSPFAETFTNPFVRFSLVFLSVSVVVCPLLIWSRSMTTLKNQLESFSVSETRCHCCDSNHVDAKGEAVECDREIIMTTIRSWFGSVESFEEAVKVDVQRELQNQLGVSPFGFWWIIHAGLPVLLTQVFEKPAAIFRYGDTSWSLAIAFAGIAWYVLIVPINFGSVEFLVRKTHQTTWGRGFGGTSLLVFAAGCVYLSCHMIYFLCMESFDPLLGALIFFPIAALVFTLIWCKR